MSSSLASVPFADGEATFAIPTGWRWTLVAPPHRRQLEDLDAAIRAALAGPLGSPPVVELARDAHERAAREGRRATATVVVTDATRDCPDDWLVPPLLAEIEAGGIETRDITVLVATGLHRASTADEKRAKLGPAVAATYRVVDHDARDAAAIVELGTTAAGVPVTVNRYAVEADLLIATGIVEPHQYAGWSGGAKTVAIGVAGEATIAATHAPVFLDQPGVRLARLDGNPFHDVVVEAGRRAGLSFVIDVVLDPDGHELAVAAGTPDAVHARLVAVAAEAFTVQVARQADVAIAGVGGLKDANLYQASRAVTYLHFGPRAAVRPGGVYLLPAAMPEGAGRGVGERRFFEAMASARDDPNGFDGLRERLRQQGTHGGEQRAYVLASVLRDATVIVVGALDPAIPRDAGLATAVDLDEGLELAGELEAKSRTGADRSRPTELFVVPHAIRTLPIVAD